METLREKLEKENMKRGVFPPVSRQTKDKVKERLKERILEVICNPLIFGNTSLIDIVVRDLISYRTEEFSDVELNIEDDEYLMSSIFMTVIDIDNITSHFSKE